MPKIFVLSEDPALARQLLTPALELKNTLAQPVAAVAFDIAAAEALASLGADQVILAQGGTPEALASALADLIAREGADVVLVGGTLRGKHLAAHLAARLKAGLTTDARTLAVAGKALATTRILYGGLAVAEEQVPFPAVATVPARTFLAPGPSASRAKLEPLALAADPRVQVKAVTPIGTEGVDITAATRLVSVGRGFRSKDDLKMAKDLADALKGDLACTRGIAEDEHWLPIERYIGISGQTVKPELYLAAGLSGQVQHMVGCRESRIIVAVNSDERAPIFEAADYGIVGDLYQVLPLLTSALSH